MAEKIKIFEKKYWLHAVIFLVAILPIIYFVPGLVHKTYDFEIGKPWNDQKLLAPKQMTVPMDEKTEMFKRDSINSRFVPFFTIDESVEKDVMARIDTLALFNREHIKSVFHSIYAKGVVENDVYENIKSGKLKNYRIIENGTDAKVFSTAELMSAKMAYETLKKSYYGIFISSGINIQELIKVNYIEDSELNKKYLENEYRVACTRSPIEKGTKIIDRGEIVTAQKALEIKEAERIINNEEESKNSYPIIGFIIIVFIIFALMFIYISVYRRNSILDDKRKLIFVVFLLGIITIFAYSTMQRYTFGPYVVPVTLVPVIIVTFFDSRTAFFLSVMQVLLCSLVVTQLSQHINFITLHIIPCIVAIYTLQELTKRSQLIRTAICVFLAYSVTYVALLIIKSGGMDELDTTVFLYFLINAALLSFAYLVIFVFEKIFGFVSKVTLVELSDINNPLLQELSEKCPGTFQHSVQLSNLVGDAAREIGANSQLARAGALYHDIGKMDNPAFFTENQHDVNPHDVLDPEQSAKIIIRHVTDGLRRAEKKKLPMEIRNFILEHHGKSVAKYFYTTACNNNGGEPVDPTPYTYPGPNPRSKETAILMMADATEAASRSLKVYNDETISNLVNKIIDGQIAQGLMKESPLSFRDVETVKKVFISRLRTMYHTRISYPELKKTQN